MISIVIPYYQRTPGVLARALASVAAQRGCPMPVHLIVVDDASPAPAEPEISAAMFPADSITLVKQPNAGAGAARNAGLDRAPKATRYIAFLDSDDEWSPDHLAHAAAALGAGYDFYFADHHQLGQTTSAFARAARIRPDRHPTLENLPDGLHAYQGDMFDQIIRGNPIGTSTVVYDFTRHAAQRFKVEFTNAGEDYLFWMQLVRSGARIAFSSRSQAQYGKGVNIYSGSGWGSENHLLRLHDELRYRKVTAELFPLTPLQRTYIRSSVRTLRVAFIRDLLHRVAHRKKMPLKILRSQLGMDPWTFGQAPLIALQLLMGIR